MPLRAMLSVANRCFRVSRVWQRSVHEAVVSSVDADRDGYRRQAQSAGRIAVSEGMRLIPQRFRFAWVFDGPFLSLRERVRNPAEGPER